MEKEKIEFKIGGPNDLIMIRNEINAFLSMCGAERDMSHQDKFIILRQIVSGRTGIPGDVLDKKTRKREIVNARQYCHHRASLSIKGVTLSTIGQYFGQCDHSSVLHSRNVVNNRYETERDTREVVDAIEFDYKKAISKPVDAIGNLEFEHIKITYNERENIDG